MAPPTLTQTEAEKRFSDYGFTLLDQFTGHRSFSKVMCPCGNIESIKLKTITQGRKCCNLHTKQFVKLNQQEAEKEFIKYECVLIDIYSGINTPVKTICKCKNTYMATLGNIRAGKRCGCKHPKGIDHPRWIPDREALIQKRKYAKTCYSLVRRCLKGLKKNNSTIELLKYTPLELQNHITSHPNYIQVLNNGPVAVDHIFPLIAFEKAGLFTPDYFWLINSLDNLRPINEKDNSTKNDKYNIEEFNVFLKNNNIDLLSPPSK